MSFDMICLNGAEIYEGGSLVRRCLVPYECVRDILHDHEEGYLIVYCVEGNYIFKDASFLCHHLSESLKEAMGLSEEDASSLARKLISIHDFEKVDPSHIDGKQILKVELSFSKSTAKERLLKKLSGYEQIQIVYPHPTTMEILSADADKGKAIEYLKGKYGLKQEEIACIGDSGNDEQMFARCGLTFCVANGTERLKKMADIIMPDNDHDGAAQAMRIIMERNRQ